ncbi:MAG: hypothetical protein ACQESN_08830, partial [Thermotogota bacterium]
ASYDGKNQYIRQCNDLHIDNTGTKVYFTEVGSEDIWQYSMSTPWDISTMGNDSYIESTHSSLVGLFLKPDGTKMYVVSGNTIYQYSLSTPYDIDTITYDSINISAQASNLVSVFLKPDGTKMYELDNNGDIYQNSISLSDAWINVN